MGSTAFLECDLDLAESANDLTSLKDLLQSITTEADGLLVQQSRVTAELQDGLMRTRMVPAWSGIHVTA